MQTKLHIGAGDKLCAARNQQVSPTDTALTEIVHHLSGIPLTLGVLQNVRLVWFASEKYASRHRLVLRLLVFITPIVILEVTTIIITIKTMLSRNVIMKADIVPTITVPLVAGISLVNVDVLAALSLQVFSSAATDLGQCCLRESFA